VRSPYINIMGAGVNLQVAKIDEIAKIENG
jgi:hypothetical protein